MWNAHLDCNPHNVQHITGRPNSVPAWEAATSVSAAPRRRRLQLKPRSKGAGQVFDCVFYCNFVHASATEFGVIVGWGLREVYVPKFHIWGGETTRRGNDLP